jgi:putative glycerol-1-phosphate prenyltransferase
MTGLIQQIYKIKSEEKRALAVLIDPDYGTDGVAKIAQQCRENRVDFVFVGGSLVSSGIMSSTIRTIRSEYKGGIYIFPGNEFMIDEAADGILFLSLLSGRNPEYLIGKQVVAAPLLAESQLEVISTAYLLIDGGKETSVSYISNTKPIPADKTDIAVATALAGKFMGMQCVYMDAGSGAFQHIPVKMVSGVSRKVKLPLIIGGGIRDANSAVNLYKAGADLLVIGNGAEDNSGIIAEIANARNLFAGKIEV